MGFKANLSDKLRDSFKEEDLDLLPRGFQSLGKVMILKLHEDLREKKEIIAKACLEMFPGIKSVYLNLGKIEGTFRTPGRIVYIAGEENSIIDHKEHGVTYRFDFTKIMFSMGNLAERKHLATIVKEDELIVDMFAGIGYFSLPIAKHSNAQRIYSIELNPESFTFLQENIKLNHFEEKIIAINGDCKLEVLKLSNSGFRADRVIMGVFPAPKDFIKEALSLTKDTGTIFHYEGVAKKEEYMELFKEFEEIAGKENLECKLKDKRFVKSYGPHLYHVVLDISVSMKK